MEKISLYINVAEVGDFKCKNGDVFEQRERKRDSGLPEMYSHGALEWDLQSAVELLVVLLPAAYVLKPFLEAFLKKLGEEMAQALVAYARQGRRDSGEQSDTKRCKVLLRRPVADGGGAISLLVNSEDMEHIRGDFQNSFELVIEALEEAPRQVPDKELLVFVYQRDRGLFLPMLSDR